MSGPRKTYRLYSFDGVHKVLSAELIEAACDEDALAGAEAVAAGAKCELWDGRRLVAQIEAERRQA